MYRALLLCWSLLVASQAFSAELPEGTSCVAIDRLSVSYGTKVWIYLDRTESSRGVQVWESDYNSTFEHGLISSIFGVARSQSKYLLVNFIRLQKMNETSILASKGGGVDEMVEAFQVDVDGVCEPNNP